MKINRQGAMIGASVAAVLAIAGGSAWALNSDSSTGHQQVQQADVADTTTPSPSATATASPTDMPTTAAPTTTAPETATAPAATLPAASPTSTKKANVSTPTSEPTTEHPVSTDPPGAVAGQWNGGTGTVDNGPYPSRGPVSTEIPKDPGGPAPDPRVSPSSTSTSTP